MGRAHHRHGHERHAQRRGGGAVEIVPAGSGSLRLRRRYGVYPLAVHRRNQNIGRQLDETVVRVGDTLLLEARPAFVSRQRYNKDFLLVSDLDTETPRHDRAWRAWAILIGVISLASFGVISMLNAALLGAGLMIISRCCSISPSNSSANRWKASKSSACRSSSAVSPS